MKPGNVLNVRKKDIFPRTATKQQVQERLDNKDEKNEQGFGDDLK